MSWFKGAIDKVKEKGAAVKGMAKEVAFKTMEVRSRLLGAATAAELQTQLEIRAGSVETCESLEETLRFWLTQLQFDVNLKGYRYPDSDGERSLSFTQVLIRSNCIEELLACIVCSPSLRGELLTAWLALSTESPDASPSSERTHANSTLSASSLSASSLRQFLMRTLTGDESVWFELVTIFLSPHGHDQTDVPADTMEEDFKLREHASSADWVARCQRAGFRSVELSLLRALKRDWFSDWLEAERRDLALSVDAKRTEMFRDTSSDNDNERWGFWEKVRLSGELVGLYEQVKDNLDTCSMHRVEENKERMAILSLQAVKVQELKAEAEGEQAKSVDRQSGIKANAQETEIEYQPRLVLVQDERALIDGRIQTLEEQRRQLKLQLESVSAALVTAQTEQRLNMEVENDIREELSRNREKCVRMLDSELVEEHENLLDSELNSRSLLAIEASRRIVNSYQAEATAELGEIYTKFDNAFVEAVQDHISVLCESVQEIYRRCKRVADDLEAARKNRSSQSMAQVLKSEQVEFNASIERVDLRLAQLETKLQEEGDQVAKFREKFNDFFARFEPKLNANRLLKGEVDKVNVVLAESTKILARQHTQHPVVPVTVIIEEEMEIGEAQEL